MATKTVRALVTRTITHGQGVTVETVWSEGRQARELSTSFPYDDHPEPGDFVVYEIDSGAGRQPVAKVLRWEPAT